MTTPLHLGSKPREGLQADSPGSYAPAVRLIRSRVDPGDDLEGDVFITGYGDIGSAKLVFYPSSGLFDSGQSMVMFGYKQMDGVVTFGGQEAGCGDDGVTLLLVGGVLATGWERPSLFFDMKKGDLPPIATETRQGRAPVSFRLRVRNDARPGEYQLQFILTYFNGMEWRTTSVTVSMVVRNLLQRYEIQAAILASTAAVVAIAPAILWIAQAISKLFHMQFQP